MKGIKRIIFLANLLLLLIVFNAMVIQKERTIKNGELVLLELVPRDPRSLMQGDYMVLRYQITQNTSLESIPSRGYCIIEKGVDGVGKLRRFQANRQPLSDTETAIRYYNNSHYVSIGAESFFFEEGQANNFANAQYGALRVDAAGNPILTGLYDMNKNLIKTE